MLFPAKKIPAGIPLSPVIPATSERQNMAPSKDGPAKSGKNYVPTGKPRGRRPGQKNKKTLTKEKMREVAAEMREKGGRGKKD